jgi:hypothetical protein
MSDVSVRFCQQWTPSKALFAGLVWAGTFEAGAPLHPRILLAWMAKESGGATGEVYNNYLQIKGVGDRGSTSDGFAKYSSEMKAAAAAIHRIKQEEVILKQVGNGPENVMRAITRTWDDGPGVTVGKPNEKYLRDLKQKFDCIDRAEAVGMIEESEGQRYDAIIETLGLGGTGFSPADGMAAAIGYVGDAINNAVRGLWPLLLKGAGVSLGLGLIGLAVASLARSSTAGEHAKQAASTTTAVVGAVR